MKRLIALMLLFLSPLVLAEDWEYKVVFLPGTVTGSEVKQESSGAHLDVSKTEILNKLGASGWELIAVTGASSADHALYLKRKITGK